MTDSADSGGIQSRAEEFMQVFKKGAEFTQGLLKENERLRYRVLEVEQQLRAEPPANELQQLKERLQRVEFEKQEILDRISSVEKENLDFSNRYLEIEAENNLLANLYITTYQLHSTFEVQELFRIIEEILLNLVGVEEFLLLLRNENGEIVQSVVSDSGDYQLKCIEIVEPKIIEGFSTGQSWVASAEQLLQLSPAAPLAVIPLLVGDEIVGLLAVQRLLAQKQGFTNTDEEIFGLLRGHAAMAICTAVLRLENKGRLGFRSGPLG
ncbi:GAF domain-containing protein [Geopsychrobacter electrodiphilus]|uniref:GAF domain-containing protein n=1 Tax=Geopsychrobacter electrodiphilus TaxID=225196 RepID=UPI0003786C08|nr:GAF domain-containing protein [Geopsychrobacter electrodiphilus]